MSARDTLHGFGKRNFASATDWIVQLAPGVRFRCTCSWCSMMPLKSSDFYRVSSEEGFDGTLQRG
eukprot:8421046-Lingulodinium_polyedra.AAC.1